MLSEITNKEAIRLWGWLSERRSLGVTVGMHVVDEFCDGGVNLNLSDIAAKMITNKNCLKKHNETKAIIVDNCCCSLCKIRLGEIKICTCVNNTENPMDVPRAPFFIRVPKNKKMLMENFFKILRKRAREYEYGGKIYSKTRQAKIDASGYKINLEDIKKMWEIQKGKCFYCDGTLGIFENRGNYHIDHLEPLSSGGEHTPLNLAIACVDCNLQKCNKSEESFLEEVSRTRGDGWLKARQEIMRGIKKEMSLVFSSLVEELSGHPAGSDQGK
jgi:5-methylcytosine-specific restriction endonuclease McrA